MIQFTAIIPVIKKYAPQAGQLIIKQAQKNDAVIKILLELKLNPTEIPDDVDTVYAYALVKYGVFKPEVILNLLGKKEIKDYFWEAYTSNSPFEFFKNTKKFLKQKIGLQEEILNTKINTGIKLLAELEDFGEEFISVAKCSESPTKFQPYPDWDLDVFPKEFKALILEKTRLFCGREFVFEAFKQFLDNTKKGYFTVIGDAGIGKSAIAAKYVLETKCPCYFNIFAEGRNKPEQFLASIRQQLIKRYSLQNADTDDLRTLLQKASDQLQKGQKLVIVIDALDEVEQEGKGNLLDLPQNIPDGVYFFLTRRPFNQKNQRLSFSPQTPTDGLNLSKDEYKASNQEDIKEYLYLFLKYDEDYKYKLSNWLKKRNISDDIFIREVALKSENNFMYLRYVLPWIAKGKYKDFNLKGLPQGLKDYYNVHWQKMGMDDESNEIKVKILYILVVRGDAVSSNIIAEILDLDKLDKYDVESMLDDWVAYLKVKPNEHEQKKYFSFYHKSFLEFLQGQGKLNKGRRLFREVNQKIYAYFNG